MTIRSTGGRVAAYAWLVFAVLNLIDLVFGITGDPSYSLTTAGIGVLLLLGCGIAYSVGLRPAIIGDDEAVTIRNPLRDVRAPWGAVRKVEGTSAVTVRFAGPDGTELETRAWVHQTSPRAQAKAEARARKEQGKGQGNVAGALLTGRTPAAFAAQQLNEIRDRQRPKTRSGAPDTAAEAKAQSGKAKAGSGKAEAGSGKARADGAEESVRGTVRWSVPAVASLAVPLAVLIALAIVGAVN